MAPVTSAGVVHIIEMKNDGDHDHQFVPQDLTITLGGGEVVVRWVNREEDVHSVHLHHDELRGTDVQEYVARPITSGEGRDVTFSVNENGDVVLADDRRKLAHIDDFSSVAPLTLNMHCDIHDAEGLDQPFTMNGSLTIALE